MKALVAVLVLLAVVLAACSSDNGFSESHVSDEPVTVLIWDPELPQPRILLAQSASQEGPRLRQTRFSGVILRMPMEQGEVVLHTDHALIDQGGDGQAAITLYPPLLVTGVIEGFPLQGRAQEVSLRMPGLDVSLQDVVWIHAGQQVRMEEVVFANNWQERRARGLSGQPAAGPFLASQAALPPDLVFPAYLRKQ